MLRTLVLAALLAPAFAAAQVPRVVISSDFPPVDVIPGGAGYGPPEKRSDTDDVQSMIRFLLYANEFRVEGLVAAAGTVANVANKAHLLDLLNLYDQVDENLRRHDPRYPTANALRQRTTQGLSGTYGQPVGAILGPGKDSEASRFLVRLLDDPDPAPVWFCAWGGSQELAQALWHLRSTRSPEATARAVAKLRVYLIAKQDGTAQWLRDEFPDLFLILSEKAFSGLAYTAKGGDRALGDSAWVHNHVRTGHGPLGAAYPKTGWLPSMKGVTEGDTPSFLHLLNGAFGLGDPEQPAFGGWGGRFVPDADRPRHWSDAPEGPAAVTRWQAPVQNDFAARMDWCVKPPREANHPPKAALNGDRTTAVRYLDAAPGQRLRLSARGSTDPDGAGLTYRWEMFREAGSHGGNASLDANATGPDLDFTVPAEAAGATIHLLLAVTDAGTPALTRYRRAVVRVR